MKLHHLLLAAIVAFLPLEAFADGRELATKNFRELEVLAPANVAAADYVPIYDASARAVKKLVATGLPGGAYDASAIASSSNLTGNPLMQMRIATVTTAQANANTAILASVSGKTIYPSGGFTVMASGSASGATSVSLKCEGGNIIGTFPIAALIDGKPVGPFASVGQASIVLASALTRGCPASQGIFVSSAGTLATTTQLYITFPYTVQ